VFCIVAVPLVQMSAVQGDNAHMPCDISAEDDDTVVIIMWYREDLGTPIYT